MGRFLLLFVCIASVPLRPINAQKSANAHQHDVPLIDGALHPELISDSVAYRLYLSTISLGSNPTDTDLKRQRAQLSQIGLQDNDREALRSALVEFRAKYDDYVKRHNQSAEAAEGRSEQVDVHAFVRQLNDLVKATRITLRQRLTPAGLTQFEAFVQAEKTKMKVQPEED
jgi:hypothetical protein